MLEESPGTPRSRTRLLVGGGAVLLVIVVLAGAWLLLRRPAPSSSLSPAPRPAPVATAAPPVVTAPAPIAPATPPPRRGVPKPKAPPPPPEPAAPVLALKVDSDVPGAMVFVDRVYVGTTPLTTTDVKPGTHVLNVSVQGYESQARTIELASGTSEVMVRFTEVRLDEAVAVVHKHAIGSCEGRLIADLQGLRYETSNKEHAFAIPFPELQAFEVDYLKKNLRVTRKGGKTFNFTDRNPNADALFVFHKKVDAARAKLATAQPAAVK
jgi:hypothetical protein